MLSGVSVAEVASLSSTDWPLAVAVSAGADGSACALLVRSEDAPLARGDQISLGPDQPYIPPSTTERTYDALYVRHDGHRIVQETQIEALDLAFPRLQPMPDGEVLLVASRCERFPDGTAEKNAQIRSADGALVGSFTAGDGVADVQTSGRGEIWVSYFDEGVYGNLGWEEPIGSAGLVRFGRAGQLEWSYSAPPGLPIDDCYALNVTDEETWAYYYSNFPLARIRDGQSEIWQTHVAGADALAVAGDRAILLGGYEADADRVSLLRLGNGRARLEETSKLRTPEGASFEQVTAIGRGADLHVFDGSVWYRMSVPSG